MPATGGAAAAHRPSHAQGSDGRRNHPCHRLPPPPRPAGAGWRLGGRAFGTATGAAAPSRFASHHLASLRHALRFVSAGTRGMTGTCAAALRSLAARRVVRCASR
eukprot:2331120-Prymnesium_polylepis.1